MITICDDCGKGFTVELKERNCRKDSKYSKERYFICPHCKHKYVVCRFDKRGEVVRKIKAEKPAAKDVGEVSDD